MDIYMAWPHYATYSTLMSHFHFVSSEIIIANLFQLKKQKAVTEGRLQASWLRSHLVPPFMDRQCSTFEIWIQKKTSRTWNFMNGNIVQLSWYISQADFFRYLVLTKNIWIISLQSLGHIRFKITILSVFTAQHFWYLRQSVNLCLSHLTWSF